MSTLSIAEPRDVPTRIRKSIVAARYGISERLAADWIRQAIGAGAAVKRGRWIMARPSELDAFVMAGSKKRGGR